MATDLERLVVSLEANIKSYERSLAKAINQTNTSAGQIEKRFRSMNKNVSGSLDLGGMAMRGLGAVGVGVSTAASLRAVSQAAQQYTDLQNSLKVTGLEGQALDKTFGSLFQIAQKNGTAIAPLVTLYSRAAQAQGELNASSSDLMRFTDGVSTALRVAGTNSTQAAGALLQLSQAIGGGVVRAEEFNSVNEGARPILQAVAAGLEEAGGSVSKLKTLVNDGKVSSEAFFRAFLAGMPQIEAQASRAAGTIGQANDRIANAFLLLVGHLDKTTSASTNAASNLQAFGQVLEQMPGYFDAALKKLDEFQGYLTRVGNSSIWSRIATFMGADLSPEGLRAAGITPPEDFGARMIDDAEERRDRRSNLASRSPRIDPVSLRDFKVPGKDDKGSKRIDPFQRAVSQIERRTAVLNAETAAIDLGAAAQARARVETELETAAKRANEAAGLKNTEVTAAQRQKITELADAYMLAAQAAEAANSPLNQFARSARDSNQMYQTLAVDGLRSLEDGLVDIVTGAENAAEAFKKMAQSILADIARIAIRQGITGPLAGALGGMFGGSNPTSTFGFNPLAGAFSFGGARAGGGPVSSGKAYLVGERGPEIFAPGKSGMVIPNNVARHAGGNRTVTYAPVINAPGASREDIVAAMEMAQRNFQRSILPTVIDARGRGAL